MPISSATNLDTHLDPERHAQLEQLAPYERTALVVLAASAVPINRTEWLRQVREEGLRRPSTVSARTKPRKYDRAESSVGISTTDLASLLARAPSLVVASTVDTSFYSCAGPVAYALLADPSARELIERMRSRLSDAASVRLYNSTSRFPTLLMAARLALFGRAPDEAAALFAQARASRDREAAPQLYSQLLDPRSPVAALSLMPAELRAEYAGAVLHECLPRLDLPGADMLAALAEATTDPAARAAAAMAAALSGEPGAAERWLGEDTSALTLEARAVLALQRGEVAVARGFALQAWHAPKPKRQKQPLASHLAPLLTLLLATGDREQAALARMQIERVTSAGRTPLGYHALALFLKMPATMTPEAQPPALPAGLESLCVSLVTLFLDAPRQTNFGRELQRRAAAHRAAGVHWLAAETEGVLARSGYQTLQLEAADAAPANRAQLVDLYTPELPWERSLSALEALVPVDKAPASVVTHEHVAERRMVFHVRLVSGDVSVKDPVSENTLTIEPKLQTRRGNGYTAGRSVALRTLYEGTGETDHITAEDRRVIACIQSNRSYWGGRDYYFSARVPLALVGHPLVFWADRPEGAAVPVVKQAPRLCARRGEQGFYLCVEPPANSAGIGLMTDAEGRLMVTDFSLPQLNVQRTVADLPPVPEEGEGRLRVILGRMSTLFTVESQVGVDAVEQVSADARIVLQLARAEPGLRVRVGVAPLGLRGPRFTPGTGTTAVAAEVDGKRLSCVRDLVAEGRALAALVGAAPALGDAAAGSALHLDSLPVCLDVLQILAALQEQVLVEWPAGAPLIVSGTADLSSLRLTLGEETSWLTATGALNVDEHRVLELMDVLKRRTPDGRFVALGDDRYLALSPELQDGLGALEAAASQADGALDATLRVPPIALGFVSPWLTKLRAAGGLKTDRRLARQIARIEQAYEAAYPVPHTFQAELRAYQVVGFEFLARLGQLGAGACLADDMGLGKTLMTLALLVARAEGGPALIVAPTSVRANWFEEALRFAPTLRMLRAEELEQTTLAGLQPYDVVVTSYTLMAQRIEQIERVRFSTVVLDEAQTIKNAATQRGRAASRLVADARVALTGTPVENHLGDLYGIMSFLNPGLLGDAKSFETRFAKPIQRERDPRARLHLRTLIAPFVLRRRKNEVLRELPARTEITLRVEPEAEERAFTEALRRAALMRLQAGGDGAVLARSTVSILAEITRLRRAACHPHLVDPSVSVGAAKLECLVDLVRELKEGGHRALIFSQFVDFLKLVRTRIEVEDTACLYLDGSTPESARRKAISEFQAGHGDVFLISLKAGGFGLNLTAADYVIHLDPWWNPAVEAQASDRAHRIGQQRPVTIYRLVNAASIEERVLALHARKQTLAEEILSESAEPTRLDPQALLALLSE